MENHFDVIVIGQGAMGCATSYQLAKRGKKVLGIDQFDPPHDKGSSHGETRITRLAIGEGSVYTPMAKRSHEIWKEIEAETGVKVLFEVGYLGISSDGTQSHNHKMGFFETTLRSAEKYNIEHEILNADQIRERFPAFKVQDNEVAYFEPEGGYVKPEDCIVQQLSLAKKYGAQIKTNEKVLSFEESNSGVKVFTDKAEYTADKLVITAGPWLQDFIPKKEYENFMVTRQFLAWFSIENDAKDFDPENMPTFIWELPEGDKAIYGFPAVNGAAGGVKIANEQHVQASDPNGYDTTVTEAETTELFENYIKNYFPGLNEKTVNAVTCLYTDTSDVDFVIDRHPSYENVIVASPCSGHGFKHSAAIGEILCELATVGKSTIDVSSLAFSRFSE